jgi:hypothetical protein
MVTLTTSDNESFVVDKDVAERSVLIKNMLEGSSMSLAPLCRSNLVSHLHLDVGENDHPIPLPNVSASVLKKVVSHRSKPLFMLFHLSLYTGFGILRTPPWRTNSDYRC